MTATELSILFKNHATRFTIDKHHTDKRTYWIQWGDSVIYNDQWSLTIDHMYTSATFFNAEEIIECCILAALFFGLQIFTLTVYYCKKLCVEIIFWDLSDQVSSVWIKPRPANKLIAVQCRIPSVTVARPQGFIFW